MHQFPRSAALGIGAMLLVVSFLSLSAQGRDSLVGTWKQNPAKSTCTLADGASCLGAPPKVATTRTYEDLGGGWIYVTNDGVNAQGMPTGNRIIFRRDGKDYAIAARGQQGYVTIAFTVKSTSPFVADYVSKLDGKVTSTSTESVSRDGKTYTATTKGTNAQGQATTGVVVYERQGSPATN